MDNLESFGGYRKAQSLFGLVADDVERLMKIPALSRLVSQQLSAADSICANIDEGYGRGSRKEFIQFLHIARGSAREVRGRYERMQRWFDAETVPKRVAACSEIIAILTKTIQRLRANPDPK